MPGARFEPDTPQLHILGVKKEKKPVKTAHTSHTRWIISGSVSWADYFRSTLATTFTGSQFA